MARSIIKGVVRKIVFNFYAFSYIRILYNFAWEYVKYYRGENNADMQTNGEYKFLRNLLSNNHLSNIFDIGANIGEYSLYIQGLDPRVNIFTFEPSASTYKILRSRVKRKSVLTYRIAISNTNSKKAIFIHPGESSFNSLYNIDKSKKLHSELVATITLDTFCKNHGIKHIDLVKIDTEGHEYSILQGATKLLKESAIEIIQFEYGVGSINARVFFRDFLELFTKYGYKVYKIKPNELEEITQSVELEGCLYANFLAVKNDSKFNFKW